MGSAAFQVLAYDFLHIISLTPPKSLTDTEKVQDQSGQVTGSWPHSLYQTGAILSQIS